jgi:hypothetical protein
VNGIGKCLLPTSSLLGCFEYSMKMVIGDYPKQGKHNKLLLENLKKEEKFFNFFSLFSEREENFFAFLLVYFKKKEGIIFVFW